MNRFYCLLFLTTLLASSSRAVSISVLPEAACVNDRGMRITFDDKEPAYVQQVLPAPLSQFRARFYLNLDDLNLANGDSVMILEGYTQGDLGVFALTLRRSGLNYFLASRTRDNNGSHVVSNPANEAILPSGCAWIELNWHTGVGDGGLDLFVNSTPVTGITSITNSFFSLGYVRFGAIIPPAQGTEGTLDLDDFLARNTEFIGTPPKYIGQTTFQVVRDAPDMNLFLATLFQDEETNFNLLSFGITGSTNAAIFTQTQINSGFLALDFAPDISGTATISIRCTDADQLFADQTLTFVVDSPPTALGLNPVTIATSATETIDLTAGFSDFEDGPGGLVYTVQNVADPSLITGATVVDATDALELTSGTTEGTTTITLRATDSRNQTADTTLSVTVETLIVTHSSDTDSNNIISLSELLRVIQFFNSGSLHCQAGSEDGFDPGAGDTNCDPHASDFNPQDFSISLSELLRLIQFFSSGGYVACPADPISEDGFCLP